MPRILDVGITGEPMSSCYEMTRLVVLNALYFMFLISSLTYAQEIQPAGTDSGPGYDYYTAEDSVKNYRDLVTSAHTDKILEWVRLGRMDTAVFDVRYTLDRFANHPKGLQLAGIVATLTKKPSLAVFYFERAVKLYPQYAITHAQYGAYLSGVGQTDAAIARLQEALRIDPKMVAAYALLAKAYIKAGKTDLARESADKAREFGYTGELTP